MQAVGACCFLQLIFCLRIAVINQFIKLCQGFVQVVTVTNFINIIPNVVGDIPQALQRITGVITLRFDRCIAKFRSGLNEEDKQHTIHIAQALQRQLTGIHRICFQVTAETRFHIIKNFISKQLNALTKRIFQILRNSGSVFLTLFIQFIQQNFSVIRAERVPVQKNRHCLQGCIFQPRENLLQFKLQIALLIPLVAVDQGNLIHANQHNKARRFSGTKENLCYQILVWHFTQNTFIKSSGCIFIHIIRIENEALHNAGIRFLRCGQQYPEQGRTIALRHFQINRNRQTVINGDYFRLCFRVA